MYTCTSLYIYIYVYIHITPSSTASRLLSRRDLSAPLSAGREAGSAYRICAI